MGLVTRRRHMYIFFVILLFSLLISVSSQPTAAFLSPSSDFSLVSLSFVHLEFQKMSSIRVFISRHSAFWLAQEK